jgi:predicted heme/steroid binding protein
MKRSSMVVLLLVLTILSVVLLAGCGGGSNTGTTDGGTTVDGGNTTGGKTFTLAELAQFDGKDGRLAYVAVDGVVYDVSGSAQWPQGDHTPCNLDAMAGKDLSEVLKQAPARMRGYIEAMPVVGTMALAP